MNIIEGLQEEIKRVNSIIVEYEKIPAGIFASNMMKASIANAEKAIAFGDTIEMIKSFKDLEGYTL